LWFIFGTWSCLCIWFLSIRIRRRHRICRISSPHRSLIGITGFAYLKSKRKIVYQINITLQSHSGIGLVQVGKQAIADRYTYLPSLALFFIAGLTAAWVSIKVIGLPKSRLIIKIMTSAVVVLVFGSLSYLTFKQIRVWENSYSLWTYVMEKGPQTYLPYYNRGTYLMNMQQFNSAILDFDKAIALKPVGHLAYANRGAALVSIGQFDKALSDLNMAIALKPHYEAYINRGIVFEETGRLDTALTDYERAIVLNPSRYEAYYNRGVAFEKMRQFEKAIPDFDTALALRQNDPELFRRRGLAYFAIGQVNPALFDLQKACESGDVFACQWLQDFQRKGF
jgi:tetratricopeptide (TPR) repeat protein